MLAGIVKLPYATCDRLEPFKELDMLNLQHISSFWLNPSNVLLHF
jgi:hypothetical protein